MSVSTQYRGVVVPMVSPFTPDGAIDEPAVARIVDHLVVGGVSGVFPLGTTGESVSIPTGEKRRLVAAVVRAVNARSMVYAGISGNCLRECIDATVAYRDLGVDAVVAHPPFYYPLRDDEIEAWFLRLADALPLPLVLYNIPSTTRQEIALDVVDRLRRHERIVAIKDSSSDPRRIEQLLRRTGGRAGFPVLLGASPLYPLGLRCGAVGLVPSGAHLVPELYHAMYLAAMSDDYGRVDALHQKTSAACQAYLHARTLPEGLAKLKAILETRGLCRRTMLPPIADCHDCHDGSTEPTDRLPRQSDRND